MWRDTSDRLLPPNSVLLTLYLSAPVLVTFELPRELTLTALGGFVGSRRRHPLRRDRAIQGRGIRSLPSLTIFVSDVSVTTPVSFLDLSAERASLRDRQDHFHVFAVTQNTLS